jgi:hypothetical protein
MLLHTGAAPWDRVAGMWVLWCRLLRHRVTRVRIRRRWFLRGAMSRMRIRGRWLGRSAMIGVRVGRLRRGRRGRILRCTHVMPRAMVHAAVTHVGHGEHPPGIERRHRSA